MEKREFSAHHLKVLTDTSKKFERIWRSIGAPRNIEAEINRLPDEEFNFVASSVRDLSYATQLGDFNQEVADKVITGLFHYRSPEVD